MKRACLLIVVPALLVALGFAQTPAASSNTDPTSIKGCLGGSDSKYTLVEDNTGRNFEITTTSVDLKPHLGHDVTLSGQKASGTATSGAADNSFAVTSLNMISEHCAAAAAAPAGSISAPADTAISPREAAAVPAATIPTPADTTSAPAAPAAPSATTVPTPPAEPAGTPTATAPVAAVPTPAETASAPTAAAITTAHVEPSVTSTESAPAPAATVSAPPETAVAPKAGAAHRNRMPADHPRPSATPAAGAPSAETATPVADAAKLPVTDGAPSEINSTPDAAAATPAVNAKKGSSWIWISIAVVVLIMGTLVPLINRWRKRRLLAQSDGQNLSFSHRASSESGNTAKPVTRKAA